MNYNFLRYLIIGFIFLYACGEKESIKGKTNKIPVTTNQVTLITSDSALGGGSILDDGGDIIKERGICWSINKNPTVSDSKVASGIGKGSFSIMMKNLSPNTSYNVRAYSISEQGEVYGNEVNFRTQIRIPSIVTTSISNLTGSKVTIANQILSDGGATITQRGVCWSSSTSTPTINDSVNISTSTASIYDVNLSTLMANTTYWLRAYARNSAGPGYSPTISFRTSGPNLPELSTVAVTNITRTTAIASASVNSNGGAVLSNYGICVSAQNTMIPKLCYWVNGNIRGPYSLNINNLNPGTTYYVRAYANNAAGEGSSTVVQAFTTLPASPPTVVATSSSDVLFTSASMFGSVTDDGGSLVLERGFYISDLSTPNTSSTKVMASSTGTGNFSVNVSGLQSGKTYYYRAYARNSINTSLSSNTLQFNTKAATTPILSTIQESNVTANSITTGGNISNDGGVPITSRGVVWSTTPNTNVNTGVVVNSGSGSGLFTTQLTSLPSNSTIYFKAFARNQAGLWGYGIERTATTRISAPTLISPSNNVNAGCCILNFSWSSIPGISSYQIQLSMDASFTSSVLNISQCGGSSRPLNGFVNVYTSNTSSACLGAPSSSGNGIWYWRVRAVSGTSFSDWSSTRSFNYRW